MKEFHFARMSSQLINIGMVITAGLYSDKCCSINGMYRASGRADLCESTFVHDSLNL